MELADLKHFNTLDMLKYLAYLQVCQENSSHLQILQELQNRVLKGEDIISDENSWKKLEDAQIGLFVENYICRGACQFRAFVSDATDRPWQLCVLVESLVKYQKLTFRNLCTVVIFLHLSDRVASRLGFGYYEIGDYTSSDEIKLLDIDDKKQECLEFTKEEINALVNGRKEDFDFIDEYCCYEGCDVGIKPFLKTEKGYYVLSPNAIMNCAWRELLKAMKEKMSDEEICEIYHAAIAEEIHNSLSERWRTKLELMEHGRNVYSAVYLLHNHRYFVVTVATKETEGIDVDSINPHADMDYLDVSSHLELMDNKIMAFDKDARAVHIVIPITMQNELSFVVANSQTPTIIILWQPLKALLKKDDDNAMWLYYYALDRNNTQLQINPDANEEDVIALYLKYKRSFYFSDKVAGKQMAYLNPGFALPLLFDIKRRANIHTVVDHSVNLIVEKDQDSPEGLPFYETRKEDCDLMVGEFMISSIFIRLPKNTKEDYPDLHAVGRSIILWYYALEKRACRPILMHNLKISVERDDDIMVGFTIIAGNYSSTLTVGQNLLGEKSGHDLEQSLLTAVLHDADKKGYVLFREYKALLHEVFASCQGGLIYKMSGHDLLCDATIGERNHYVVDNRRKSFVIGDLAEMFNHYPEGPLTIEESKTLVDAMIHYLNHRITSILEQYDLETFLTSLSTLRDGIIFWSRTMHERYNYMISFYRFLGTDDPVQEKRIHEFVETDLCARCLIEYALMKCTKHGDKDISENIDTIEEMFACMSELVNMGYLSDYYKSPSFNKVIEVLPNARFAYPQDENTGLSKYAKYVTKDRLEHPAIYDKLNAIVKELDYREYEEMFKNVFISEFGVEFKHFSEITIAIIRLMQDGKQGIWIEEIGSFKKKISTAAQVNVEIVEAYITAFSISPAYQDLSYLPMFKEYDTYPCRYKRKLGLIYRPICVFQSDGKTKVLFSYRGFVQSQYNLLDNIRISNYSCISDVMGRYIGMLNRKRGRNFEAGVFELYVKLPGIICHRSAKIGPKEKLLNKGGALGDIDIMLIDNKTKRIMLVEAKNYNECKTPYEAVAYEKKMLKDMAMVVKRDKWARDHKDLFESYARTKTTDYQVASIMLTFNLCPAKIFCDNYETPLPIVWIRDVIENPMLVFDYGNYS